jgi:Raf kinase inhibitor-like YbhB/YbcL family protein
MRRNLMALSATLALILVVGVGFAAAQQGGGAQPPAPPPLKVMSTGLTEGSMLADKFTCSAKPTAVNPALTWSDVPPGTASFAVIVHDLEPRPRKGFDDVLHWMIWNIPPTATGLPEGVPAATAELPDGARQSNGQPAGNTAAPGYRGPCPPMGVALPHHYSFEVFALDQKLDAPAGASRADVTKAMDGHIIGHAVLMGLFHR